VVVDAGAADVGDLVGKREVFLFGDVFEHAKGLGHDLGPDVVSRKNGEFKGRHKREELAKRAEGRQRQFFAVAHGGNPLLLAAYR
jgi:hypothetical protein